MGNIGYCTRGTRMLQIVKGSDLVSGVKQTAAYKVGDDVKIISGEPIYATKSGNEMVWTKDATGASAPFFAFTDSDSFDVIAAGSLLGISVLDTYELQTPLFLDSDKIKPGVALTVKSGGYLKKVDGNIEVTTVKAGSIPEVTVNYVDVAEEGKDAIIGYVTEGVVQLKGNVDVAAKEGSNTQYIDGYIRTDKVSEQVIGGPSLYTEASKSKYVLQFATAWKPAVKTEGTDPEGNE